MASEGNVYACCFCNEQFTENGQFWAHMAAGNCETKAELPPPPPLTVQANNSHLNERREAMSSASAQPPPQSFTPSPFSSSSSSTAAAVATSTTTTSSVNSSGTTVYDFTQMTNAVPSFNRFNAQQLQPPHPEVPLTSKKDATNVLPLMPKINSQPAMTSSASAPKTTAYDKWKCTLCNVTFSDKVQLVHHVSSPEHESRLPANPKASKPFPRPSSTSNGATPVQPPVIAPSLVCPNNPQPALAANINGQASFLSQAQRQQPPPLPPLPNQEALAQLIRKIFMEEIRPLVREEIRCLLRPLFQEQPGGDSASPGATFGSNNNINNSLRNGSAAVAASSSVLEPRGVGYFCHACNCSVPSQVNLEMHCSGKRHKAALDKVSF
ncbi:unnamed protein product [Schistocephalus solidus]|uniref:C2H2-type zinc finger n=1 Tax=Schistocephalus solidus TaxID=70667 RepID=A0A183TAI0_SCHSO|nr:unnamed protein product [Schistocephalus solidus]